MSRGPMVRQRAVGPGGNVAALTGLVLGVLGSPALPQATAADHARQEQVIEVHVVGDRDGAELRIYGTDLSDSIQVEPFSEDPAGWDRMRVWVGAGSGSINLVDDIGLCVAASPQEVVCPDDLTGVAVSTGAGRDGVGLTLGPDPHDVTIDLGTGSDRVWVLGVLDFSGVGTSLVQVWGGDGNDEVSDSHEVVGQVTAFWGGAGADEGKGVTQAYGGGGNDILAAGNGVIRGEPDDDEVLIPTELRGGPGADIVRGARADDDIWGGPGPDRITAHHGNDVANGGTGSDVIKVDDGRHDDVNCGQGADRVRPDSRDFIVGCEIVF